MATQSLIRDTGSSDNTSMGFAFGVLCGTAIWMYFALILLVLL